MATPWDSLLETWLFQWDLWMLTSLQVICSQSSCLYSAIHLLVSVGEPHWRLTANSQEFFTSEPRGEALITEKCGNRDRGQLKWALVPMVSLQRGPCSVSHCQLSCLYAVQFPFDSWLANIVGVLLLSIYNRHPHGMSLKLFFGRQCSCLFSEPEPPSNETGAWQAKSKIHNSTSSSPYSVGMLSIFLVESRWHKEEVVHLFFRYGPVWSVDLQSRELLMGTFLTISSRRKRCNTSTHE